MAAYVLDTSAVLSVFNQEDGFEAVVELLKQAQENQATLFVPFMALMELEYLLLRKISPEEMMVVLHLVNSWPVQSPESNEHWRHQAAKVKNSTSLSVADAWIAGLALLEGAALVHKDPEYEGVPGLNMVKLPYRT